MQTLPGLDPVFDEFAAFLKRLDRSLLAAAKHAAGCKVGSHANCDREAGAGAECLRGARSRLLGESFGRLTRPRLPDAGLDIVQPVKRDRSACHGADTCFRGQDASGHAANGFQDTGAGLQHAHGAAEKAPAGMVRRIRVAWLRVIMLRWGLLRLLRQLSLESLRPIAPVRNVHAVKACRRNSVDGQIHGKCPPLR